MATHAHALLKVIAKDLEPKPHDVESARKSHAHLRNQLDGGTIGTRIRNSWLIGSYARRTIVAPIDDTDILFAGSRGRTLPTRVLSR